MNALASCLHPTAPGRLPTPGAAALAARHGPLQPSRCVEQRIGGIVHDVALRRRLREAGMRKEARLPNLSLLLRLLSFFASPLLGCGRSTSGPGRTTPVIGLIHGIGLVLAVAPGRALQVLETAGVRPAQ